MRAVVVTACTQRKSRPACECLLARNLPRGRLTEVVDKWLTTVKGVGDRGPAGDLYAGRGFGEVRGAARSVGGPLLIVSAGLGLLAPDAMVPAYSLTAVPGSPDYVFSRIDGSVCTADWWRELQDRSPFADSFEAWAKRHPDVPILIALSSAYLGMVQKDLLALDEDTRVRLRFFGRGLERWLDPVLKRLVMPYDGRLDGSMSPIRGTQSDFSARAMRHFTEAILPVLPWASKEVHRRAVETALSGWTPPVVPRRSRLGDDEIRALIRQHWHSASGQSARMLRVLRDDLSVACEQGRFRDLFHEVKSEREQAA